MLRDYAAILSGSVGRLVVSLAYFVALANTLPTADFGVFATASAAGVVLSRIVGLGFSSPLYRVATVKRRLLGAYTAGYLAAFTLSLPPLALGAMAFYWAFFRNDTGFLPFAAIVVAEALLWRSAEIVIIVNNGLNRFRIAAGLVIFGTAVRAAMALGFTLAPVRDLDHWAWWYVAANAVSLAAALWFYPRVRLRLMPRLYARRIADSLSVAAAELLFYLQNELDKLLVLGFGGPDMAGVYAILMRLVDLTAIPVRSFNMMLVQRMMRDGSLLATWRKRLLAEAGIFAVSVAGLMALVAVLSIFPTILGRGVAPVAGLLPLVLLVPGFRNLVEYHAEVLYARGQSGVRAANLAVLALAKAALMALLIAPIAPEPNWPAMLNPVFAALYALSLTVVALALRRPAIRI